MMNITASWIWNDLNTLHNYNVAAAFRKEFELSEITSAEMAITADSWYRLYINGTWVNDGPCRSYPSHYQYDVIDATRYLHPGKNRIEVTVRYFGIGTFHQLPQQAGLLAQLEVHHASGNKTMIMTDDRWQAAALNRLVANTAKVSIQQEPFEMYDATRGAPEFRSAIVIASADKGPWHDLNPRDCRLLSRREFNCKSFISAAMVGGPHWSFSIPVQKILYPGNTQSNLSMNLACGVAFNVRSNIARQVDMTTVNLRVAVNGRPAGNGILDFNAGDNLLLMLTDEPFTHGKDLALTIPDADGLTFHNPLQPDSDTVAFLHFPEYALTREDIPYFAFAPDLPERIAAVKEHFGKLLCDLSTPEQLARLSGHSLEYLPCEVFSQDEAHWQFRDRRPAPIPENIVTAPENMLYTTGDDALITPLAGKDIELLFDLGEQNCGYWDFALEATAGTIVDIFAVEYITTEGKIQHTNDNRNGMRYVCHDGYNTYTSLKRRSGRYLFVTLRCMTGTIRFNYLRLIESTYPVEYRGDFYCSDFRLNRIWEISARTMKLCMEDTFTDCPLYEQTLWVGDARNEALFAFPVFGAWDLARRCIRLAGISLEKYPITGCQVPSGWDCLLPAWSFMWGLSVWDYYFETADVDFLREAWPWVEKNLDGAQQYVDPSTGLFRMAAWNLFDWSKTDSRHETLLFNTMFMIGAIDAAIRCATVLQQTEFITRYISVRRKLSAAVNRCWQEDRQAFPDRINADGTPGNDIAVHTSMLSILYDIIDAKHVDAAKFNTLSPHPDMIAVSSPFASLYYYETLEKLGEESEIMDAIRRDYQPMLDLGATTVWETYIGALSWFGDVPTRSHCHGWSAAPLLFFGRIILGLKMIEPGGRHFSVSPYIGELDYASGHRITINGTVKVEWRKEGNTLRINAAAPAGILLEYTANPSHAGWQVIFNHQSV